MTAIVSSFGRGLTKSRSRTPNAGVRLSRRPRGDRIIEVIGDRAFESRRTSTPKQTRGSYPSPSEFAAALKGEVSSLGADAGEIELRNCKREAGKQNQDAECFGRDETDAGESTGRRIDRFILFRTRASCRSGNMHSAAREDSRLLPTMARAFGSSRTRIKTGKLMFGATTWRDKKFIVTKTTTRTEKLTSTTSSMPQRTDVRSHPFTKE